MRRLFSVVVATMLPLGGCGGEAFSSGAGGAGGSLSAGGVVGTGGAMPAGAGGGDGPLSTGGVVGTGDAGSTGEVAGAVDASEAGAASIVCCDDWGIHYCNCYEHKTCTSWEEEVSSCPDYGHCCRDRDMPDFCTCWDLVCSDTIGVSTQVSGCP